MATDIYTNPYTIYSATPGVGDWTVDIRLSELNSAAGFIIVTTSVAGAIRTETVDKPAGQTTLQIPVSILAAADEAVVVTIQSGLAADTAVTVNAPTPTKSVRQTIDAGSGVNITAINGSAPAAARLLLQLSAMVQSGTVIGTSVNVFDINESSGDGFYFGAHATGTHGIGEGSKILILPLLDMSAYEITNIVSIIWKSSTTWTVTVETPRQNLAGKYFKFVLLPQTTAATLTPSGIASVKAAVDDTVAGKKIIDCPVDSETKRFLTYSQSPMEGAEGSGFLFELSLEQLDDGTVVEEGSTTVESEHILDATATTTAHTNATIGTRYRVNATILRNDPAFASTGANPPLEYVSLTPAVGLVNPQGIIEYVADGEGEIEVSSPQTEGSPARTVRIGFTNSHAGGESSDTVDYEADVFNAADHALVLYNTAKTSIRDAYLSDRPGVSLAGTLGLSGIADSTVIDAANVDSLILTPVYSYLETHQAVRNIVVLRGLPSRDTSGRSIAYLLSRIMVSKGGQTETNFHGVTSESFMRAKYPGLILVSVLDAGSDAATLALVAKMKAVADADGLLADGVTISAAAAGLGGDQWMIDSKRTANYSYYDMFSGYDQFLTDQGIDANDITFQDDQAGTQISAGTDVTFIGNWGLHNGVFVSTWPDDGSVVFDGASNWFAVQVEESLCGQVGGAHSDPVEHFAANAYGGTSYSNTPICMVGYTSEPYITGLETRFFACAWAAGRTAAEATAAGENSNKMVHFGDPWIVR